MHRSTHDIIKSYEDDSNALEDSPGALVHGILCIGHRYMSKYLGLVTDKLCSKGS